MRGAWPQPDVERKLQENRLLTDWMDSPVNRDQYCHHIVRACIRMSKRELRCAILWRKDLSVLHNSDWSTGVRRNCWAFRERLSLQELPTVVQVGSISGHVSSTHESTICMRWISMKGMDH
jgi:hypothetical protein